MEAIQAYSKSEFEFLQKTAATLSFHRHKALWSISTIQESTSVFLTKCKNYHTNNESDLEVSAFFMHILPLKNSNIFIYEDLKVKTFSNKADVTRVQAAGLLSHRS